MVADDGDEFGGFGGLKMEEYEAPPSHGWAPIFAGSITSRADLSSEPPVAAADFDGVITAALVLGDDLCSGEDVLTAVGMAGGETFCRPDALPDGTLFAGGAFWFSIASMTQKRGRDLVGGGGEDGR